MTNRTITQQRIAANLNGQNLYGRTAYPEVRPLITARRIREAASLNRSLVHPTRNGCYDPVTFYHVVDVLAQIDSGQEFRSAELLGLLREAKPQVIWDATTVGRVMTDIAETLDQAYGWTPIGYVKRWNGMTYDIIDNPQARVALLRLLDDLKRLSRAMIAQETRGEFPKKYDSPLRQCPSALPVTRNASSI